MPILTIQRRMAEQGRIRLGQKVGSGRGRPEKLDRFRFTSANERLIADIATLYGGEPRPWDNGGKAEHEVITDAKSIPVIVVKGGFSQWMETWSGGGCTHRCDGVTNALTGDLCDPDEPGHRDAKPTTRLSVMLSEIETLGVWRMESKGWNAAAELPSMADLAMVVGDLVPATLHLVERKSIRDGKTSRFVVPVLDLAVSKQRLVEIVGNNGNGSPAIEAGPGAGPAAIEAPRPDYATSLAAATSVEECQALWHAAGASGHLTDDLKDAIMARVGALKPPAGVATEDVVDGEPVDDDIDAVWMQLVMEAGRRGMTEPELRGLLEQHFAQPVPDLDATQLREALTLVKRAEVTA